MDRKGQVGNRSFEDDRSLPDGLGIDLVAYVEDVYFRSDSCDDAFTDSDVLVGKAKIREEGYIAVADAQLPARGLVDVDAGKRCGIAYLPCWRRCHLVLLSIFLCFFLRIFFLRFFTTDDTNQPFLDC